MKKDLEKIPLLPNYPSVELIPCSWCKNGILFRLRIDKNSVIEINVKNNLSNLKKILEGIDDEIIPLFKWNINTSYSENTIEDLVYKNKHLYYYNCHLTLEVPFTEVNQIELQNCIQKIEIYNQESTCCCTLY